MKKLSLICVSLSIGVLSACSTSNLGKADKKFAQGEYETAIQYYQEAINKGKDVGEANFKIAESYRKSNRLQMAEPFYKAAIDNGIKKDEAFFFYGMSLKANGKYEEATSQLTNYMGVGTNKTYVNQARMQVEGLAQVSEILKKDTYMEVTNLESLNTPGADFAPVKRPGTDEVIFSSSRGGGKTFAGNGEGFQDLYTIKLPAAAGPTDTSATTTASSTVTALPELINTADKHEATAAFSADGNTMIFARGNEGSKKGRLNVDLYITQFRSGTWTEPRMISINDANAWESTPAFSPDGTTLYFSSDRRNGKGGNDIYKTTLDANGRFSTPVNMAEINTPGNENFPYVAENGTLYFSSDGHPGLGMLDLFKYENGKVENMGSPMNSTGDDFGLMYTAEGTGFLTSNRTGGKGSDDIYAFAEAQKKMVTFYVDGSVVEKMPKTNTTKPVGDIKVTLMDNSGKKLEELTADSAGKFSVKLDTASSYSLLAEKTGYFAARQSVSTVGRIPSQNELPNMENDIRIPVTLTLNKIVKDKAIEVKDIFYDYAKWDIREDAAIRLDTLVQTLNDNPKISIELSSHTDSRGKDAYNLDLSQKRAQSAVDYIISKGIDKKRVTAKGYGETKLRNKCKNGVKCTEEQHQFNRRTEFKVTRIAQ